MADLFPEGYPGLAIGGKTEPYTPPSWYLAPGPDQRLDGYHGMWYARSRSNTNDYDRMKRQSCLVKAIVNYGYKDPDFPAMRRIVAEAVDPPDDGATAAGSETPSIMATAPESSPVSAPEPTGSGRPAQEIQDECAYLG